MKTKFQAALRALKANQNVIVRKATIWIGVGVGAIAAGAIVDKIRKPSDDTTVSGAATFDAPSGENPFNTL